MNSWRMNTNIFEKYMKGMSHFQLKLLNDLFNYRCEIFKMKKKCFNEKKTMG